MNEEESNGAAALSIIIGAVTWWIIDFKSGIAATVIAYIIIWSRVRKTKNSQSANNPGAIAPKNYWLKIEDFYSNSVDIKSDAGSYMDMFRFEAVGESNYQRALNILVPEEEKQKDKHKVYYIAKLALEDDNEYDKNAIAVEIDGMKVGYIPKEENKALRKKLKAISQHKQSFSCMAAIIGGSGKHYGVWLNI